MGSDPQVDQAIGDLLDAGQLALAASSIVRDYGPQLLGYLRAVRPHDAEAAFAAFCAELAAKLPSFARTHSVLVWSYQLAWTAARRTGDPVTPPEPLLEEMRAVTATTLTPEAAQHLIALRADLDAEEQTLLVLRIDRDMEWRDVAHVLASDVTQLKRRYEVLAEKVRRLAKQRGLRPGPG